MVGDDGVLPDGGGTGEHRDRDRPEPPGLFLPVEVRSATEVVIDRLQTLILDGRLRPGDRLPNEPDLAQSLGVGRTTVREAKKTLMARGLLEARGRLGTYVSTPPSDPAKLPALQELLADPALPDLHEARQIIEVGAIQLAAKHATPADVRELYAILDYLADRTRDDPQDLAMHMVSFHRSIVRAAHNKVLLSVFDLIAHLLRERQVPYYVSLAEQEAELRSHRELVELISRGDATATMHAMEHHLEDSERLRREALQRTKEHDAPS